MAKRIVWSDKFRQSVKEYMLFSQEYYSRKILTRLWEGIKYHCEVLADNPHIGMIECFVNDEEFRRVLIKPFFKLIYTVQENDVILICIWDTRQNPDNLRMRILD